VSSRNTWLLKRGGWLQATRWDVRERRYATWEVLPSSYDPQRVAVQGIVSAIAKNRFPGRPRKRMEMSVEKNVLVRKGSVAEHILEGGMPRVQKNFEGKNKGVRRSGEPSYGERAHDHPGASGRPWRKAPNLGGTPDAVDDSIKRRSLRESPSIPDCLCVSCGLP